MRQTSILWDYKGTADVLHPYMKILLGRVNTETGGVVIHSIFTGAPVLQAARIAIEFKDIPLIVGAYAIKAAAKKGKEARGFASNPSGPISWNQYLKQLRASTVIIVDDQLKNGLDKLEAAQTLGAVPPGLDKQAKLQRVIVFEGARLAQNPNAEVLIKKIRETAAAIE